MSYSFDMSAYIDANTRRIVQEITDSAARMLREPYKCVITPSNIEVKVEDRGDGKFDMVAHIPNNLTYIHLRLRDDDTKRDWTLLGNLAEGFSMRGCPLELGGLR
jgi:hypothetical protein